MSNKLNKNEEKIKITEYEIPKEERDVIHYVDILNVFTVYFKTLFHKDKTYNILKDIELDKESSTNRAQEMLFDEIILYKNAKEKRLIEIYDVKDYKEKFLLNGQEIPEKYDTYLVVNKNNTKITHSLVTALSYIASLENWYNVEWSINKINNF